MFKVRNPIGELTFGRGQSSDVVQGIHDIAKVRTSHVQLGREFLDEDSRARQDRTFRRIMSNYIRVAEYRKRLTSHLQRFLLPPGAAKLASASKSSARLHSQEGASDAALHVLANGM